MHNSLWSTFKNSFKQFSLQQLKLLAYQNHADAQFQLGLLYEKGSSVVEQDLESAYRWFHIASQNGHLEAGEKLTDPIYQPLADEIITSPAPVF